MGEPIFLDTHTDVKAVTYSLTLSDVSPCVVAIIATDKYECVYMTRMECSAMLQLIPADLDDVTLNKNFFQHNN